MAIGIPLECDRDERLFFGPHFLAQRSRQAEMAMTSTTDSASGVQHCDLAIIGSGLAAIRLVETLRRRGDRRSIVVLGAERALPYNRILLSPLLSGEIDWQQLVSHPAEWYGQQSVELRLGHRVAGIDRAARCIDCDNGYRLGYRQLVIATGSRAALPRIPGIDLAGVAVFREMDDVAQLQQAAGRGERVVVLGGGLLGLEAAVAMAARGASVTVVHRAGLLMNRQLDNVAADYLRRAIERRGVTIATGRAPVAIQGSSGVAGVLLDDGTQLEADRVIAAIGIEPCVEVAVAAGLPVNRGIEVDNTLVTQDPAIFAVGECCERDGETVGLVAPIWQQVEVLAANLCGEQRRFESSPSVTMLKVSGIDVHAMGETTVDASSDKCRDNTSTQVIAYQDRERGIYKKLLLRDRCVVGALLFGDIDDSQVFFRLLQERIPVAGNHCRLLLAGELPASLARA
jgi:nitrite reductase (NADH) large subunit